MRILRSTQRNGPLHASVACFLPITHQRAEEDHDRFVSAIGVDRELGAPEGGMSYLQWTNKIRTVELSEVTSDIWSGRFEETRKDEDSSSEEGFRT